MDCSVIICTRDRASQLPTVLNSIAQTAVPPGLVWEVLVVDNGSTDETAGVIAGFETLLPIKRIWQPVAGLSNARNAGIAAAAGRYIIWTDDDCRVTKSWLTAFNAAFAAYPDAALFGGRVTPVLLAPTPPWFAAAEPYLADLLCKRDFGPEILPLLPLAREPVGACFAVLAAVQREFLYDPALGVAPGRRRGGEEVAVIQAILQAGHAGFWIPAAGIDHMIQPGRQSFAGIKAFYASEGEREVFGAWQGKSSVRIAGHVALAAVKAVIRYAQFQALRLLGRNVWVKYLTYYETNLGIVKFGFAHNFRAPAPG